NSCQIETCLVFTSIRRHTNSKRDWSSDVCSSDLPADLDKYQRALGDALTQAGVIKDVARIVHWDAWKIYHPDGWVGVQVTVKPEIGRAAGRESVVVA